MESFSEDVIEVYHSLYQSAKTIEVKAPKKIYKSGKRVYDTTTKGVYFLYYGSTIVYVGRSVSCIEARLYKHKYTKEFNYARVIEMSNYNRTIESAELYFINLFNPIYNYQDKEFAFDYKLNKDYKEKREEVNTYLYTYDTNLKAIIDEQNTK